MPETQTVAPFDMILCLTDSVDLVSPAVAGHQLRTAYIAGRLAAELGAPQAQQNDLILAGALHDVGALSLKEKLALMQFDVTDVRAHAEIGYRLLMKFAPFTGAATLVRHHHTHWRDRNHAAGTGAPIPAGSHLMHLADRVDVLIDRRAEVLGQVKSVRNKIEEQAGEMFAPEHVAALMKLAPQESFWLDIVSPRLHLVLAQETQSPDIPLHPDKLASLADMFRQMIDFRSRFTATHSSGVAATAETLAGFLGFSADECRSMRIAGCLHDLGKLAIPSEILEKPAKLTHEEMCVVRHHTYYGFRALQRVKRLETINMWGSLHHERLNGEGYPFHLTAPELTLGSRIMAVADVFTALTEERPYRQGMTTDQAETVLDEMADASALDRSVVNALRQHAGAIEAVRVEAQDSGRREYDEFWRTAHVASPSH